ncbi:MAG: cytochrome c4 [Hydrogenophilales bacterium CG_4_9_14_3_um_filter_59_35]|nr:MAG: cytochrome C [Hydrogenophilales bacterium CG18_big_fil_WC_8_21_14_2_50_58_12]PIX99083.1 MAG: cytochrome c4 [Hydrogenophilales bacterium CG_4_10_14_3_um_filter_58_23]PJB07686.1 MAG: cytochrome c4 [Hydrogenophilales bacterium CG_4_9_14_3_um_filter_59_35]
MRLTPHQICRSRLAGIAFLLPGILLSHGVAQAQAVPLAERLQLCAGCHNPDGNSIILENPKLSGLDAGYIVRQLRDFKSGIRKSPVMSTIIPMVDEKEFPALAEFFSKQQRKPGVAVDAKRAAQGKEIYDEGIDSSAVPACSGCHNDDGSGTDKYPRIGGQNSAYVIQQLMNFKSGERANDVKAVMRAVAKRMNEKDIRAVAEYMVTLKGEPE